VGRFGFEAPISPTTQAFSPDKTTAAVQIRKILCQKMWVIIGSGMSVFYPSAAPILSKFMPVK